MRKESSFCVEGGAQGCDHLGAGIVSVAFDPCLFWQNPRQGFAFVFALGAKKDVSVFDFAYEIGTLNMGLADNASHADSLVCANGCDKDGV